MLPFALTIPEEENMSLFEELWLYFENVYIKTDSTQFEHLGFGLNTMTTIRNILFALFLGIIIASFAAVLDKRHQGELVRKLLREGCVGEQNAKSLYELGLVTKSSVRHAVRKSVNIRRVVKCLEEQAYERENPNAESAYRIDAVADHFYIPEDKRISAEVKFANRGIKVWLVPVVVVVSVVGFFGLMLLIPYILQLLDEMIGSFNSLQ